MNCGDLTKKELKAEINRLKRDENNLDTKIRERQSELSGLRNLRKKLEKELELRDVEVTMTDHAVLRYLERVLGLDIDQYKEAILKEIDKRKAVAFPEAKIPLDGGGTAVVKDGRIITITP